MSPAQLLPLAGCGYALALGLVLLPRAKARALEAARAALGVGLLLHLAWLTWRGFAIGFFPLTNKAESFSAAGFALALVAGGAWLPSRAFLAPQLALALAATAAGALAPQAFTEPGPLLRTWWYPAHVPLSFLGLATWSASAAAGLAWAVTRDAAWLARTDRFALQGLGLWSAAMVFGGVWGVLAWGSYFLWDPKLVWSTILWFHYAAFVHVRLTPSLQGRPRVRPALAWLGIVWVLVAYVGTSLFFGKSTHAF
jgi:ABC-type transport system involved in cytochrome c biogenesis permease subunit